MCNPQGIFCIASAFPLCVMRDFTANICDSNVCFLQQRCSIACTMRKHILSPPRYFLGPQGSSIVRQSANAGGTGWVGGCGWVWVCVRVWDVEELGRVGAQILLIRSMHFHIWFSRILGSSLIWRNALLTPEVKKHGYRVE